MKYFYNFLLGILSIELGQMLHFIPEPETAIKGAILAVVSGFMAGFGRWCFYRIHKLFTKPKL